MRDRPALAPSGRCDECGFDAAALDNDALVDIIDACRVDPRTLTEERPAPGTWSPREYAWHLHEAIAFYAERIESVLTADRPQLAGRDFTRAPAAHDVPVEPDRVVTRLRALTPAQWARVGLGSSDGAARDVRALVARLAHECVHHGLDIDRGVRAARS